MIWLWINLGIVFVFAICWFSFLHQKINIKRGNIKEKKSLANLVVAIILIDCFCTLVGQSEIYWTDYSKLNEANPFAIPLLRWHPLAFTFGLLFWAVLCYLMINFLSKDWAVVLFLALFLGHSLAVYSWITIDLKEILLQEPPVDKSIRLVIYQITDGLYYIFLSFILLTFLKNFFHRPNS